MRISRKDFLKAGAAVVTSAIALQACGDDGSTAGPTGPGTTSGGANNTGPVTVGVGNGGNTTTTTSNGGNGGSGASGGSGGSGTGGSCAACVTVSSMIGTNHGHAITVPTGDVTVGAEMTYGIMGSAVHGHSVTVSAANFTTLQTCGTVMVTSTTGSNHTHVVTVSCAA
jgi:hypothetical protein